jgi:hypothetical protein
MNKICWMGMSDEALGFRTHVKGECGRKKSRMFGLTLIDVGGRVITKEQRFAKLLIMASAFFLSHTCVVQGH